MHELWRGLKAMHSALSRAESARKRRSHKKKNQERVFKDRRTALPAVKVRFFASTKRRTGD